MESKNPIQVADKLFLVLETLARTGPIGLSDLCREVSLNKTTVHRLLNSLLLHGICAAGHTNIPLQFKF